MPQLPLRIAVLECGAPLPKTASKYGGYGGVFKALLNSAADALSYPGLSSSSGLQITNFDVEIAQEYPSLEDIDAILITGSKYNAFDNDAWILKLVAFVEVILKQRRVRIIGVCFGHQIVGRAMEVKVFRSEEGWEASVTAMDLTKRGQEIFGRPALALHQMHRDIVYEYPEGVEELAYTEKCAVQGMYVAKRLITVQGHPEFNEEIVREILDARHTLGIFDAATYQEMMGRVDKYQDGLVVAQAFLRFLLED
ncbi:putative glutamine amidotransferase-like protein [Lachnellula occidentalis]|uniref:Putative glutamine amidotransferase-like protein n=1 Tax=Lachnellula occidentalis TaxID=215460 RepID=A0A8H8S4X2_9HELO|nr:putative glutamine amidotransferase-like protein [Lachnellula occidentalis]